MFTGLLLILIGALFLLKNIGVIQGGFWGWFWPLAIIIIGISIIGKGRKKQNPTS